MCKNQLSDGIADNVNLKMLTMFVKKCDIDAANYAQATGGQEAIDLYEKAAGSKGAFDIVFMDLVSRSTTCSCVRWNHVNISNRACLKSAALMPYPQSVA
jgi:hypothetical protein